MPEVAFRYAIPRTFYTREKIRAYGFHGTSHKYVTEQAGRLLNKTDAKLISMHLGNGCSMTAVRGGRSLDTSMGFGPVGGLIMGTRSGDMDTAVIFHLIDHLKFSPTEVNELLNKKSGMLGLTGYSDMRDIRQAMEKGDREAKLAFHMYAYRIKKYIGAYTAVLNGLDALIFTGGVGEHDELMRQSICSELEFLGVCLDEGKNQSGPAGQRDISREDSPVRIFVIAANEELEIARQCYALIKPDEK
jgi:acetate kinase